MEIPILYEDEFIICVNKPAKLTTIPNSFTPKKETLLGILEEKINKRLFVTHRLDKDTSGVILFSKDKTMHKFLNKAFENREVNKIYLGIVKGRVEKDTGIIKKPICEDKKSFLRMKLSKFGEPAETKYKVLERFKDYTLLEITPITGKRHQIRLHLKYINHPLAIDPLYANKEPIYLSQIKKNYKKKGEEKPIISRLTLHALSLEFFHPFKKETLKLVAPLPKDFSYLLKALRKYNKP